MKRGINTARTGPVRKICYLALALVIAGLGGETALALDPMGPPATALQRGEYKAALDYSFSEMDFELTDGKWTDLLEGVFNDSGQAIDLTIKDFETHRAYASLGYGIFDNWEVFLRAGGAKATFGDSIWGGGEDFDGNIDFAAGAGIRATFFEVGDVLVGGLLQGSYSEFDGELDGPGWPSADFVEVKIMEAQVALGATYRWTDWLSVYGGPFAYVVKGDFDDTFVFNDSDLGGLVQAHYYWYIDEGPNYGAYLGALMALGRNSAFNVELQFTSDANALGMGLMWRI
jgi:hypothetical protein